MARFSVKRYGACGPLALVLLWGDMSWRSALAALPEAATPVAKPLAGVASSGQLVQLVLGLLLVIGLIFLLAWLLRRVQQSLPRSGQVIKLLASQPLGPRERLLLVQVGGEQILLGLAQGSITPLHVLQQPVTVEEGAATAEPEFARRLRAALNLHRRGHDDEGKP